MILVFLFKATSEASNSLKFWSREFTVRASPVTLVIEISLPSACDKTMRDPSPETSAVIPVCTLR